MHGGSNDAQRFSRASVAAVVLAVSVFLASSVPLVRDGPVAGAAGPAALPSGFTDELVVAVADPTALAFTPDGRMLVTSQGGQLRVVQGGVLVAAPAVDLSDRICVSNERGLLGVAVDPRFASNRFVYLFWTARKAPGCPRLTTNAPVNRVSRFVLAADNTIDPAGELVLIDNIPSPGGNHNAGDLGFGKDGLLYVSTGDGGCDHAGNSGCGGGNDASRDEHVLVGKILRVDRNGGVPAANPFAATGTRCNATGRAAPGQRCQETFAWGLRNPFRIAFDPNSATTRFMINDVGQDDWEEVDLGIAGADYGWNVREGFCVAGSSSACGSTPAGLTDPVHAYSHADGCSSITGGAFVPDGVWPATYTGAYLFADYVCGSIFVLAPSGSGFERTTFASGFAPGGPVHLAFGTAGGTRALYYTTYADGGQVRRIVHGAAGNRPPSAVLAADPTSGALPLAVHFDGTASSDPDGGALGYHWTFGDGSAVVHTGVPTVDHVYTAGGPFTASLTVTDPAGAASAPASVVVRPGNSAPTVTITSPTPAVRFDEGAKVTLRATATDPEDGTLPAGSIAWVVIRRHDSHTHPFRPVTPGGRLGFPYPGPEDSTDFTSYLEATVTATDSAGASVSRTIELRPKDAIRIGDVAVLEGATGTSIVSVPVTLHRQVCGATCPVTTVRFATVAGTAAAGSDFVRRSGTLTFAAGESDASVDVTVVGDATTEPDERFAITLSAPSANASVSDARAEVLVLADEAPPPVPIRVNVGGAAYTSAGGPAWLADRGFTGGKTANVSRPIAGTTDDKLYQSSRTAMTGHHVVVPNGTYDVRLHVAETAACCPDIGDRVFDVIVEGAVVLDSFDIRAEVGTDEALVKQVAVVVTDGVLDVTFAPRSGVSTLAALEVIATATGDRSAPH